MNFAYHAGEIEVQNRAGVRAMAKRMGNSILERLPPAAAEFLAEQPMVIVSSADRAGHVWASILVGQPGFAHAINDTTIRITASPTPDDPLSTIHADRAADAAMHIEVGLLVIDLETRVRMRLNGVAQRGPDEGLLVHAREVYFNCPKYIQAREILGIDPVNAGAVTCTNVLTEQQCNWIGSSDTFFIASAAPGVGADASHRGGKPGFVHVRDAATLVWPDYSGNSMFNTLGNITLNPTAGLLFLDFDRGYTLQLTGAARVVWEPECLEPFPGAERLVEFHIERAIEIAHATPLHFRFLGYSRFNPA